MANNKKTRKATNNFQERLLRWYDQNARVLPWRYKSGEKADPYKVWLSEIMLQQTVVATVKPYFEKFTTIWPTVQELANASVDEVMKEWAGLGYYSRARNLHKCAQIICEDYGGEFPSDQKKLKKLPGIGDYTSAAIMSIAFNKPAIVIDGNVERVITRLYNIKAPLPDSKKDIKIFAEKIMDQSVNHRPSDLVQAFMDLGATICIPKVPRCALCPISHGCIAYEKDTAATLPIKKKKAAKPRRVGDVYWIENHKQEILLEKRSPKRMLGGMIGVPSTNWDKYKDHYTLDCKSKDENMTKNTKSIVRHSFTHFDLELRFNKLKLNRDEYYEDSNFFWYNKNDLDEIGFPSLFKKVHKLASE